MARGQGGRYEVSSLDPRTYVRLLESSAPRLRLTPHLLYSGDPRLRLTWDSIRDLFFRYGRGGYALDTRRVQAAPDLNSNAEHHYLVLPQLLQAARQKGALLGSNLLSALRAYPEPQGGLYVVLLKPDQWLVSLDSIERAEFDQQAPEVRSWFNQQLAEATEIKRRFLAGQRGADLDRAVPDPRRHQELLGLLHQLEGKPDLAVEPVLLELRLQLERLAPRLTEASEESFDDYPAAASKAAQQALDWKAEHGDQVTAGTAVGWARARQLAGGKPLSRETLGRMSSFFARHDGNQHVAPEHREEPWRDNGHVAWLLWGGDAARTWVDQKLQQLDQ